MPSVSILDHGAIADGQSNNASAIQAAIDACHQAGGGRVTVPGGGSFLSGTIELKANIELHLEGGATLLASHRESDYATTSLAGEYGGNRGGFLIYAKDADNIAISGSGEIDGNAEAFLDGWWTDDGPYIRKPRPFRARLIGLFGCRNLRLSQLTLRNASQWTCHLVGCENVSISDVNIFNGLDVPNCDGINPDHCRNVRISNCHIEAGDDGIVIKTTREFAHYGPSENITVAGCTIVSTSAAVKIGSESASDIRNVIVTACVIHRSHRGLAIQLRDGGSVENILFSDCIVETRQFHPKYWGNAEAIYITALPRHPSEDTGRIRDVVCRNIQFCGENGIFIWANELGRIQRVTLDGIHGVLSKQSRFPVDFFDLRPSLSEEHGGLLPGQLSGITACRAQALAIQHCQIRFEGRDRRHWRHALALGQTEDLRLHEFHGQSADPNLYPPVSYNIDLPAFRDGNQGLQCPETSEPRAHPSSPAAHP